MRSGHRALGSVLLAAVPLAVVGLLVSPTVRRPLLRTLGVMARDAFGGDDGDLRLAVTTTRGIRPGDPVYLASTPGGAAPVAWVVHADPGHVAIRFADATPPSGGWRLRVLPAASGLAEAWRVAVPPETAAALQASVARRLRRLFDEGVMPEVRRRLPAFLARVDPRRDPKARAVLDGVGQSVMTRLRPFGDALAEHVMGDLEEHFGLLERMGLLWKVVRGDAEGLQRELGPIAMESARTWWKEHQDEVLRAVGEGIAAEADTLEEWIGGEVLDAAREELAEPVLASQGDRLTEAADAVLADAVEAIVSAPEGGFRVRFSAVLRARLLEKEEPLLLLERVP